MDERVLGGIEVLESFACAFMHLMIVEELRISMSNKERKNKEIDPLLGPAK